eukprot:CAMPEP_0119063230 /NCGR_PEP_ID=MMETSP1178-20130426/6623_1 /TAXON_ID=33656 /ORGANISM="unid sp, Strain CCMP2000" /LENGTH=251 /DNA_ID=CAMNT_0007044587 /DNA_START=84 /DNA_END=839 /DNA_ORIENTATION=+
MTTVSPSPSLTPEAVVQAQLAALQIGDIRRCFEFASPANRHATGPWSRFDRMVRSAPAYSPLVCCSSFEILSALSTAPGKWRCRVRVRPAGSSSAPFAVVSPFVEYCWELSKQPDHSVEFNLGQCVRHRKYDYRGVIVGFDLACLQSDEWIRTMGVDQLSRGREQPFYNVLVDERDLPGGVATYVAQENVLLDKPADRLQHPAAEELLLSFDKEAGAYGVRTELSERYKRREDIAGCWLVDGVVPDRPVVE